MTPLLITIGLWSHIHAAIAVLVVAKFDGKLTEFDAFVLFASLFGATYFWLEVFL